MNYSTRDLQLRVNALLCKQPGFKQLVIDNVDGPKTRAGVTAAMKLRGVTLASRLFHPSGLHRIILHWTAGADGIIGIEHDDYHAITDRQGHTFPGRYKPEDNAQTIGGHYAAHTRGFNTGSIGMAVDCMAGAIESPFDAGKYPMTEAQLQAYCAVVADMAATYDIPITPWSIMSHAEVERRTGVWQRGKWDICWIPGMAKSGDPATVGDLLRTMISAARHPACKAA